MSPSSEFDYPHRSEPPLKAITSSSISNVVTNIGECGYYCIRAVFVIFNFLFWLIGLTFVLMGAWLHMRHDEAIITYVHALRNTSYVNGPNILLAIGGVTLLVSFLACCGAKSGSYWMLGGYVAIIVLILGSQVTALFLTYIYREKIQETLAKDFHQTLNQYGEVGFESVTKSIDDMQREYQCCGNNQYGDWFQTKWMKKSSQFTVPISCCKLPRKPGCNENLDSSTEQVNSIGCYHHIKKYLLENLHIINGFAVWIVLIESLGVAFSAILIIKQRKERKLKGSENFEMDDDGFYKAE